MDGTSSEIVEPADELVLSFQGMSFEGESILSADGQMDGDSIEVMSSAFTSMCWCGAFHDSTMVECTPNQSNDEAEALAQELLRVEADW